ncbi:hypothetical protein [Desulfotomaculum copahuensis]|uniref:hypothetical protein n=1 Tax=Desulfotomaculum copahuensis TaxID=1838280 RepID=UPI000A8091AC|nr:hypothetical protein [Desulfotomaculum copahuensis]
MGSFMDNWTVFYAGMVIILGVGVLAAIFAKPVNEEIAQVEERSNGRTAAH